MGRPKKEFEDCSQRSKRRKVKELTHSVGAEQMVMAIKTHLHSSGKRCSAELVEELALSSPERGKAIKKLRSTIEVTNGLSADEALAMILDLDLSSNKYRMLKQHTMSYNRSLYPSYELVKRSKELCYPKKK